LFVKVLLTHNSCKCFLIFIFIKQSAHTIATLSAGSYLGLMLYLMLTSSKCSITSAIETNLIVYGVSLALVPICYLYLCFRIWKGLEDMIAMKLLYCTILAIASFKVFVFIFGIHFMAAWR
jgi:hypothetical protein